MISSDNLFLPSLPKFNKQTCTKKENDGSLIDYQYNSFGYRTQEPESFNDRFILAFGCSHTEGFGQHITQTWTYKLSKLISATVANFGAGGSGADFIEHISLKWIQNYSPPALVIIQWPNPMRFISWHQDRGNFINVTVADHTFKAKITAGELNFYVPWVKSINLVNQLWKSIGIPVLNCYFDAVPADIVQYIIPEIHSNDINNNLPWLFDSKAHDYMHHSDWCTDQWANRFKELLTNTTITV
jgi:hypothetical protein